MIYNLLPALQDEFIEKLTPLHWRKKGLFPTEGLAFFAFCRHFKIKTIIESGVRNGDSTEMWVRLMPNVTIHSIDLGEHKADLDKTQARLSKYKNIEWHIGDGNYMVPSLVSLSQSESIGILIDGPKDLEALMIAQKTLEFPRTKFVAIHDIGEGALRVSSKQTTRKAQHTIKAWKNYIFNTDEARFFDNYFELNDHIIGTDNEDWKDYRAKYSRGCGLGVIVNDTT